MHGYQRDVSRPRHTNEADSTFGRGYFDSRLADVSKVERYCGKNVSANFACGSFYNPSNINYHPCGEDL